MQALYATRTGDFYFDDQRGHVDSARAHVATGYVPFGIANLR